MTKFSKYLKQHTIQLINEIKLSMDNDILEDYTENKVDDLIARLEEQLNIMGNRKVKCQMFIPANLFTFF